MTVIVSGHAVDGPSAKAISRLQFKAVDLHIVVPWTLAATPPPAATVTENPAPTWVPPIVCALAKTKCKRSVRSPEDFIMPQPFPYRPTEWEDGRCPDSSKAGKRETRRLGGTTASDREERMATRCSPTFPSQREHYSADVQDCDLEAWHEGQGNKQADLPWLGKRDSV